MGLNFLGGLKPSELGRNSYYNFDIFTLFFVGHMKFTVVSREHREMVLLKERVKREIESF